VSNIVELTLAAPDPAGVAVVDAPSGETVTYGRLAERIGQVAGALQARGFGPGDVLALWAPNAPPWAGVALGAMAAGGAVTGIPPTATEREAAAQVADAGATVLVTTPGRRAAAREGDRSPCGLGSVGVRPRGPDSRAVEVLIVGPDLLGAPAVDARPGPLALLPYSSGTTGLPKGVMLSHGNVLAAVGQIQASLGLTAGDTVLAVAPFCHVMGFVVTLAAPLAAGATVVTLPRFDLEAALAAIARHRITVLVVPPPVMLALAHHPAVDRHDLSSLELIVSGGAPLGAEVQRAVAARLSHAAVAQGYGLTETSVAVSGPVGRTPTAPGSVGRPMRDTEVRLVDGELWVRGPQVMQGYLHAPAATAEMLTPDGWLRTGDLVEIDARGDLFVRDRLKDLIKVNGLQVAPAELEALLLSHPGVADAAVLRRPHPRTGEVPVAVVVPRGDPDPRALMTWVAERVAPHKRLAAVALAREIPRTPSGKILRRELA
jgi:acyl-CoA synthetase (AMP-forming)/AMP-acid ligase II